MKVPFPSVGSSSFLSEATPGRRRQRTRMLSEMALSPPLERDDDDGVDGLLEEEEAACLEGGLD
jgi:hypothetical protein